MDILSTTDNIHKSKQNGYSPNLKIQNGVKKHNSKANNNL